MDSPYDEKPTDEGKKRYADGYFEGDVPCTCKPDCPAACKGDCGCPACSIAYYDAMEYD